MSETPVHPRPRRLAHWINPTGAKKVHSLIDKVYQKKNLEIAWAKAISPRPAPFTSTKSRLTRAQAQAEYIAARDEVAALNGEEDSGCAYFARMESQLDRTRLAGQPLNAQ